MLNEILESCKNDRKTHAKQEIEKLVITFHKSAFSKLEIQCKTGLHVSFNPGWHSMQLDIVY